MKPTSLFCLTTFLTFLSYSQNASLEWAKHMEGGANDDHGTSITVDSTGNVYITGSFSQGTTDFDPGQGVYNLTSNGSRDIFISKLDPSGNFEWAKQFGGIKADEGNSICVEKNGNVYTTGYFRDTVDFDPNAGTYLLASKGNLDIFISKLDAAGNFVWAKSIGGTGGGNEQGYSIKTDNFGNVIISGTFMGTCDFDPGPGVFNMIGQGDHDVFVLKLSTNGNFVWAKQFGGENSDKGLSMDVDYLGNIYTTGQFNKTVDFDPGVGVFNLTSLDRSDVFVSKLDSSGNFIWARNFASTDVSIGHSIAVDKNQNVYTTGYFNDTTDFNPGAGTFELIASGSTDMFIAKLDSIGNFEWAKRIGGNSIDYGYSISTDEFGNSYITGTFVDTVDVDPGPLVSEFVSYGSEDILMIKLMSNGDLDWAKQMGGTGDDTPLSIHVDKNSNVYSTGYFRGHCDFDPGPGTAILMSGGLSDIYVLKLGNQSIGNDEFLLECRAIIYPNPTSGTATLAFEAAENTTGSLVVLDMNGSILEQHEVEMEAGQFQYQLDMTNLSNGLYMIRLYTKQHVYTERLQVVK